MEIRIEPDLRPAFESLGALVLLRQKLAESGLSRSVLNVQDYGRGTASTEGIIVDRIVDGGFTLTLQDYPDGKRFNCKLRGLDEVWNGTEAARKFSAVLGKTVHKHNSAIPVRPRNDSVARAVAVARRSVRQSREVPGGLPPNIEKLLSGIRERFPEGFGERLRVREAIKEILDIPHVSHGRVLGKLVRAGFLIRLDPPFWEWYGVLPNDRTVSPDQGRAMYMELVRIHRLIQTGGEPSEKLLKLKRTLEEVDRQISILTARRQELQRLHTQEAETILSKESLWKFQWRYNELKAKLGLAIEPS